MKDKTLLIVAGPKNIAEHIRYYWQERDRSEVRATKRNGIPVTVRNEMRKSLELVMSSEEMRTLKGDGWEYDIASNHDRDFLKEFYKEYPKAIVATLEVFGTVAQNLVFVKIGYTEDKYVAME
ncbi:hypothetical protein JX266_013614 [Neoarthrinium moseri]|nr:hypothetical protein JX266_013614 [Neoarthrinium moseri]